MKCYYILQNEVVEVGEQPPDLRGLPGDGVGKIRTDELPSGRNYGDVVVNPAGFYQQVRFHVINLQIKLNFIMITQAGEIA